MNDERDELADLIWEDAAADRVKDGSRAALVPVVRAKVEALADAIIAAGYRKVSNEEDIDRAAKAVYNLDGRAGAWETRHEDVRELYREDARAVIAALTGR